jgi:hypothetical protein
MILWYVQFLKSKIINIELFSVGSRGEFSHFVDYGIPFSQIKIVLFILANRECLIRWRRCINIVFIFAGQWKARIICGVLILENYPWCALNPKNNWKPIMHTKIDNFWKNKWSEVIWKQIHGNINNQICVGAVSETTNETSKKE